MSLSVRFYGPVLMVQKMVKNLKQRKGLSFSMTLDLGAFLKTEAVTMGCSQKDYFGQRRMQAFEMLLCIPQHLPANL